MINEPVQRTKPLWLAIIVLLIVGLAGLVVYFYATEPPTDRQGDPAGSQATDTPSSWQTFESDRYDFTIQHPSDWRVDVYAPTEGTPSRSAGLIVPAVNIYPEDAEASSPFDHFAEVDNVSIYPRGVPTEGVVGERVQSELDFAPAVDTDRAVDYVLANGNVWATYAPFSDVPDSWESYGFLFARTRIMDERTECRRDGESVPDAKCQPLLGDEIIRTGRIDPQMRHTQEQILESFSITEADD